MPEQIKNLIDALSAGIHGTQDELLASVYQELRIVASSRLRQHERSTLLNTTALVHETYLKLAGGDGKVDDFSNRRHFFSTAAMGNQGSFPHPSSNPETPERTLQKPADRPVLYQQQQVSAHSHRAGWCPVNH